MLVSTKRTIYKQSLVSTRNGNLVQINCPGTTLATVLDMGTITNAALFTYAQRIRAGRRD